MYDVQQGLLHLLLQPGAQRPIRCIPLRPQVSKPRGAAPEAAPVCLQEMKAARPCIVWNHGGTHMRHAFEYVVFMMHDMQAPCMAHRPRKPHAKPVNIDLP